jgi:hypothetical protein
MKQRSKENFKQDENGALEFYWQIDTGGEQTMTDLLVRWYRNLVTIHMQVRSSIVRYPMITVES